MGNRPGRRRSIRGFLLAVSVICFMLTGTVNAFAQSFDVSVEVQGDTLAYTGGPLEKLAVLALALVVLGAVLLWSSRINPSPFAFAHRSQPRTKEDS